MPNLTFNPPSCVIDPSFWEELYDRKVNQYKLDDKEHEICGFMCRDGGMLLNKHSFQHPSQLHLIPSFLGSIKNFNLIVVRFISFYVQYV